jgi:uncharacterized protein (TIGR02186 family)
MHILPSLRAAIAVLALLGSAATANAELWLAAEQMPAQQTAAQPAPASPLAADGLPKEKVEADVSSHQVDVTAAFSGTEIVVFGSVDHSRQPSPESGMYDIAVVVQGPPVALTARSKSNVAGLWVNTGSMLFDAVPSFYALSTTRPLEEIAEPSLLKQLNIGFDHVRMRPRQGRVPTFTPEDLTAYKDAIVRIKQREHLYPRQDFGVGFIGRSLFRTSIMLPANVPVSSLQAHVFLFRSGEMLSTYTAPVKVERQGVEAFIHDFARKHAFLYGLTTVLLAALAGLAAATVFRRT